MKKNTMIGIGIGAVVGIAVIGFKKSIKNKPVEKQEELTDKVLRIATSAGILGLLCLMNKSMDNTQKMTIINRIDIILGYDINDDEKINLLNDLKHVIPFKDIKALIDANIQDIKGGM